MVYYFAYGGNTNPIHMNRTYPNSKLIGVTYLPNYRLVFQSTEWYSQLYPNNTSIEQSYCNIIPDKSTRVFGVLYDCPEEDIQKLDVQERYPNLYTKVKIPNLNAFTYIMNTDNCIEQTPTERYFNVVLYGYKAYNLPISQLEI